MTTCLIFTNTPIKNAKINQYDLTKYVEASEQTWLSFIEKEMAQ